MFNFRITEDQDMQPIAKGIQAKTVPYLLVLGLILLLPIFFIPATVATLATVKLFMVYGFTLIALFVWGLTRLRGQSFSLPWNLLGVSIALIPLGYILAGLFSKSVALSFFARDFAVDSVATIVVLFLLLGVAALQFSDRSRVVYAYLVLFVSFFITAVVHVVHVLIPALPSMGIFFNTVSTTLGKWNDLALFAVLIAALSMMTLALIRLAKTAKMVVYIGLALALVLMVIVNFVLAWYLLGAFALLFFIYMIVGASRSEKETVVPFLPLVVFLVSFLFIVAGGNIGNTVSSLLNINHFEVRPSWQSTIEVMGDSVAHRPVFGSGPALFEVEWLLYKPASIMATDFWNLDFRYGVGFIPTFIVTTGIVGGLTWLFFIVLFLISGFKTMFGAREDPLMRYLLLSSFVLSALLWAMMVFYLPSAPLVAFTFIMTGIYLGLLYQDGAFRVKKVATDTEPKFGFLYITVLVLLLIGTIGLGYHATTRFVAHLYFQKAAQELNVAGDIAATETDLMSALRVERNEIYHRSLAELGTIQLGTVLNDTTSPQDLLVDRFRTYLAATIDNYQSAIAYDGLNYNNYIGLANLYRDLVGLNIEGSYEQAQSLYNQALVLKTNSPDIYLALARLELANKDTAQAKEYINKALAVKPNYVDAVFLYSQIEVSEGNVAEAIAAVESAAVLRPNDPTIFFQLGLLRYNNNDFARAVAAFEQAVALNPQFQNAKYFLGLSYDQVGNATGAIAQFSDLVTLNPNNTEVAFILDNLRAGRDPFANAAPPINEVPEDRENLPLDDEQEPLESEDNTN